MVLIFETKFAMQRAAEMLRSKPLSPKDTNSQSGANTHAAKKPAKATSSANTAEKTIADDDDAALQVCKQPITHYHVRERRL